MKELQSIFKLAYYEIQVNLRNKVVGECVSYNCWVNSWKKTQLPMDVDMNKVEKVKVSVYNKLNYIFIEKTP